jgi:hypothetical protein
MLWKWQVFCIIIYGSYLPCLCGIRHLTLPFVINLKLWTLRNFVELRGRETSQPQGLLSTQENTVTSGCGHMPRAPVRLVSAISVFNRSKRVWDEFFVFYFNEFTLVPTAVGRICKFLVRIVCWNASQIHWSVRSFRSREWNHRTHPSGFDCFPHAFVLRILKNSVPLKPRRWIFIIHGIHS